MLCPLETRAAMACLPRLPRACSSNPRRETVSSLILPGQEGWGSSAPTFDPVGDGPAGKVHQAGHLEVVGGPEELVEKALVQREEGLVPGGDGLAALLLHRGRGGGGVVLEPMVNIFKRARYSKIFRF